VTNDGTINARGGAGEGEDSDEAANGGGGGGIVHLMAPVVGGAGTVDVSGGAAGTFVGTVLLSPRSGGGGGGASGGNGGKGGDVGPTNISTQATNGSAGYVLQSLVDPTSLF
jgi:hypothetical protein